MELAEEEADADVTAGASFTLHGNFKSKLKFCHYNSNLIRFLKLSYILMPKDEKFIKKKKIFKNCMKNLL